jgi:hypothetical protein
MVERCTVTIDWVLANCRTQKAFCSPKNVMFAHHCLLAEKRVTTLSYLSRNKRLHFLYPLACFYLLYVGLLLHGQASKSRMDLWNMLYIQILIPLWLTTLRTFAPSTIRKMKHKWRAIQWIPSHLYTSLDPFLCRGQTFNYNIEQIIEIKGTGWENRVNLIQIKRPLHTKLECS